MTLYKTDKIISSIDSSRIFYGLIIYLNKIQKKIDETNKEKKLIL